MSEVSGEAPKSVEALQGKVTVGRQTRCIKVKDQVMFSLFFCGGAH
jgi:hypothetical protein